MSVLDHVHYLHRLINDVRNGVSNHLCNGICISIMNLHEEFDLQWHELLCVHVQWHEQWHVQLLIFDWVDFYGQGLITNFIIVTLC